MIYVLLGKGQMGSALTFWVLPFNLCLSSQKCQGVPFSPICQQNITFAAAPLLLTPSVRKQVMQWLDALKEKRLGPASPRVVTSVGPPQSLLRWAPPDRSLRRTQLSTRNVERTRDSRRHCSSVPHVEHTGNSNAMPHTSRRHGIRSRTRSCAMEAAVCIASICPPAYLPIYLSIYPPIYLSTYPPIYLSTCLSMLDLALSGGFAHRGIHRSPDPN